MQQIEPDYITVEAPAEASVSIATFFKETDGTATARLTLRSMGEQKPAEEGRLVWAFNGQRVRVISCEPDCHIEGNVGDSRPLVVTLLRWEAVSSDVETSFRYEASAVIELSAPGPLMTTHDGTRMRGVTPEIKVEHEEEARVTLSMSLPRGYGVTSGPVPTGGMYGLPLAMWHLSGKDAAMAQGFEGTNDVALAVEQPRIFAAGVLAGTGISLVAAWTDRVLRGRE